MESRPVSLPATNTMAIIITKSVCNERNNNNNYECCRQCDANTAYGHCVCKRVYSPATGLAASSEQRAAPAMIQIVAIN